MSTGTIMRALQMRFAIEDPAPAGELDVAADASTGPDPEAEVVISELVTATLAELTMRQAKVLMGIEQGITGRELAALVGCSTGTISHERGQLAEILARLGTDAPVVLKQVLDALFTENA